MEDYFADDGSLLENKLGIAEPEALQAAEQDIVTRKTAILLNEEPPARFDFAYLKYVHRTLFEDIYGFAGQVRTVNIVKPDSAIPFAYAAYIVPEADRIFAGLKSDRYLAGLDKQQFTRKLTSLAADLNALHPFREGNGRATRLFLILLADRAGFLLDYSQVPAKELINADKLAFEGEERPLLDVYERVAIRL